MNIQKKIEDTSSYEDVVKQLIDCLNKHQRDLQMIGLVFQGELEKYFKNFNNFDLIFPHISKLYSFTTQLLDALEDAIEMSHFCVSRCFEGKYFNFHHFFDI